MLLAHFLRLTLLTSTIIPLIRWLVPISAHTLGGRASYFEAQVCSSIYKVDNIYICVCNIAIVIGVILYANLWRFIAMLIPMLITSTAPLQ